MQQPESTKVALSTVCLMGSTTISALSLLSLSPLSLLYYSRTNAQAGGSSSSSSCGDLCCVSLLSLSLFPVAVDRHVSEDEEQGCCCCCVMMAARKGPLLLLLVDVVYVYMLPADASDVCVPHVCTTHGHAVLHCCTLKGVNPLLARYPAAPGRDCCSIPRLKEEEEVGPLLLLLVCVLRARKVDRCRPRSLFAERGSSYHGFACFRSRPLGRERVRGISYTAALSHVVFGRSNNLSTHCTTFATTYCCLCC